MPDDLRHCSLRTLEVFACVAEAGSISAAARRLHLTQPTVSQQMKRLSERAGQTLLEPHKGRLQPTAFGKALLRLERDLAHRYRLLDEEMSALQRGARGRFSLALINTAQRLIPDLLAGFRQRYPEIDVTVTLGNRAEMLQRLERRECDLYIFSHPPARDDVRAAAFLSNPLVVIAPADHPIHRQDGAQFTDLLDDTFWLRESGSATRSLLESWLQAQAIQLRRSGIMASNEAIVAAVAAGMGISVVSQHVVPPADRDLIVNLDQWQLSSHWQFIRHSDQPLPLVAQHFLQDVDHHLHHPLRERTASLEEFASN